MAVGLTLPIYSHYSSALHLIRQPNSSLAKESIGHTPAKDAVVQPEFDEYAFASAFDRVQGHLARGFQLGNWYWMAQNRDSKQQCSHIHAFVDQVVDMALSKAQHADKTRSRRTRPPDTRPSRAPLAAPPHPRRRPRHHSRPAHLAIPHARQAAPRRHRRLRRK